MSLGSGQLHARGGRQLGNKSGIRKRWLEPVFLLGMAMLHKSDAYMVAVSEKRVAYDMIGIRFSYEGNLHKPIWSP